MKKALMGIVAVVFVALMTANAFACPNGFTPGFWKHNIGVHLGLEKGAPSAFEGGPLDGVKCDASVLDAFTTRALMTAYTVLSTGGGGAIAQARADMANYFNAYFGYGPFVD